MYFQFVFVYIAGSSSKLFNALNVALQQASNGFARSGNDWSGIAYFLLKMNKKNTNENGSSSASLSGSYSSSAQNNLLYRNRA